EPVQLSLEIAPLLLASNACEAAVQHGRNSIENPGIREGLAHELGNHGSGDFGSARPHRRASPLDARELLASFSGKNESGWRSAPVDTRDDLFHFHVRPTSCSVAVR